MTGHIPAAEPTDAPKSLLEEVFTRLAADTTISSEVGQHVLDALDSEEATQHGTATSTPLGTGLYLKSIAVAGFRGIGPKANLELNAGPGLTLVVGRNGTGKSSFAEAAEYCLTGGNKRWDIHSNVAAWKAGWRNLHDGSAPTIELTLLSEGDREPVTVGYRWAATGGLDSAAAIVQRKPSTSSAFDRSGMARPMELYRPFLSYSELGSLIDGKPSALHDAIYRPLGLENLTTATKSLASQRLELDRPGKQAAELRKTLLAELARTSDQRASAAAELLAPGKPDLAAIAQLLSQYASTESASSTMNMLATLSIPSPSEVDTAVERILKAVSTLSNHATADAEGSERILGLLRAAHAHVQAGGPGPCPVCGQGQLDHAWEANAINTINELEQRSASLRDARLELRTALASAVGLIQPVPAAVTTENPSTNQLAHAWQQWSALAAVRDPAILIQQVPLVYSQLDAQAATVIAAAQRECEERDQVWAPLARQLSAWHDLASTAVRNAALRAEIVAAENWLKSQAASISDSRIRPMAERASDVWAKLCPHSSVQLGSVTLQGSGTARRVELNVTVDDLDGPGLAVMSQGELHALGLALFLPRAAVAESPFRFILIDDPVQAMDPGKVEGLARILAAVARTRQVVVFTHDERLPEAVRRLGIDATILEVDRRQRSSLRIRTSSDPVHRHLADAKAIVKTTTLPADLASEVVANCCRAAVEAASHTAARRKLLATGVSHEQVAGLLTQARTTNSKVALAVYGEPGRDGDIRARVEREGAWAANVFHACKSGAHSGYAGDLDQFVKDTGRLVKWISQ